MVPLIEACFCVGENKVQVLRLGSSALLDRDQVCSLGPERVVRVVLRGIVTQLKQERRVEEPRVKGSGESSRYDSRALAPRQQRLNRHMLRSMVPEGTKELVGVVEQVCEVQQVLAE